jgi:hypothetical protein
VTRWPRIQVCLPPELFDAVGVQARRARCSASSIVRALVADALDKPSRIERGTPGNDDANGTQGRTPARRFPRTPAT